MLRKWFNGRRVSDPMIRQILPMAPVVAASRGAPNSSLPISRLRSNNNNNNRLTTFTRSRPHIIAVVPTQYVASTFNNATCSATRFSAPVLSINKYLNAGTAAGSQLVLSTMYDHGLVARASYRTHITLTCIVDLTALTRASSTLSIHCSHCFQHQSRIVQGNYATKSLLSLSPSFTTISRCTYITDLITHISFIALPTVLQRSA